MPGLALSLDTFFAYAVHVPEPASLESRPLDGEEAFSDLRRREPFAWNATNVSRELRARLVGFLAGYKAHVRFVHVEADEPTIQSRNRNRARGGVPKAVLARLAERWSPPDRTEAHEVTWA